MKQLIAVEDWVGETRAAIIEDGQIVELHVERWSELGQRAFAGERYRGRVRKIDGGLNAAFVDLGRGEPGFLPFGKSGRPEGLHEGAAIGVRVVREAFAEKGPTLARLSEAGEGSTPALLDEGTNLAERLLHRYPDADVVWADEAGLDIAPAIETALSADIAVPGGGRLSIEPTRALTAIDIDSAGRKVNAGRKLALDQNLAAMPEIARQIRLRGIGGNIVIDCLHLRSQPDRRAVEGSLKRALKRDPARIDVLSISRFGLLELVRQRTGRSLAELLNAGERSMSTETLALAALRRLQIEATNQRASKLNLTTGKAVYEWLDLESVNWREAMTDRIGPRYQLSLNEAADRDFVEVSKV
ncbi:ribonuclease E/G [Hyphobacterium sp.]|uniref:ribonuclease E/G n=1 Tax=Hyphobacterium sp. TaxID=2004662 RepID=UPI003BA9511F